MTKNYQKVEYDASALAVPDRVSVAMAEIAADLEEGLLALAVGTGTGGDAAAPEPVTTRPNTKSSA